MMHRSWIIVPALRAEAVAQAVAAGADVVVLDLVEFVVERDRATARAAVKEAVSTVRAAGASVYVQTTPACAEVDLSAAVAPGLAGVLLSRTETPGDVTAVAEGIARLEGERGIAAGTVRLVAALETAEGNHHAYDIARATPRVWGLTLGRADLVMDLRAEPSGELHLLPYLMQRLILIAGASGRVPLGAWWQHPDRGLLATPEATRRAGERGRAIGYRGGLCIEPAQVAALNAAYS